MAQTLYSLSCFLIGGDTIFKVKGDPAEEVADLKHAIKVEKPMALKDVDADHLTLYMAEIDTLLHPTTVMRINELKRKSLNVLECKKLEIEEPLSTYFGENSQSKRKYTIVKIPEGELIKTTVWYRAETVLTSPIYVYHFPQSLLYRPTSTSTSSICFILGPLIYPSAAATPTIPAGRWFPKFPLSPELGRVRPTAAEVRTLMEEFTSSLRPKIRDFLTKAKPPFTSWLPLAGEVDERTRQFYRELDVPLFKGRPSLLLHNLGLTPNPTADKLFQGSKHK